MYFDKCKNETLSETCTIMIIALSSLTYITKAFKNKESVLLEETNLFRINFFSVGTNWTPDSMQLQIVKICSFQCESV